MKQLKQPFSIFILVWLMMSFFSLHPPEKTTLPPPNIIWITSEDNSKHYLSLFDDHGVPTLNIEKLAGGGLIFRHAFSNAPVCSVARSTLISGCYGPRIGSQYHRKYVEVPMPDSLKMFPAYLREAGYYTSNNHKKDYNIMEAPGVWDESSQHASWRNRAEDQPFFHMVNIGITHESSLHFTRQEMEVTPLKTDQESIYIQPNHPDTELFRYTNAFYRDKIIEMDLRLGEILDEIKADGLLDNTFIFYFGDHGGVLPGSKGYLYETGLHVPLVVFIPKNYRHLVNMDGEKSINGFVSFIDFAPTVLHLSGVNIPSGMDGKPFLGPGVTIDQINARNTSFSYADRFDEKYDMVRAVRKGKYKYIRNYQPFNYDGLMNNYRYIQLAYREWQELYQQGKLNDTQAAFFKSRPAEQLFELESDPYETQNLAKDPKYHRILTEMQRELDGWVKQMPDLSFFPEHVLIKKALDHPTAFGQKHRKDISKYVDVANLGLKTFEEAKEKLIVSLKSADPWERYWAIIVCSGFGEKSKSQEKLIFRMAREDPELINQVRAAEWMGITNSGNPAELITACLYKSQQPAEALLILNTVVLMQSWSYGYQFQIETDKISPEVKEDVQVKRRLEFLLND